MRKKICITILFLLTVFCVFSLKIVQAKEYESKAEYKLSSEYYQKVGILDVESTDYIYLMEDDIFKELYKQHVGTSYSSKVTTISSLDMAQIFHGYTNKRINEFKSFFSNTKIARTIPLQKTEQKLTKKSDGSYDALVYWLHMYSVLYDEIVNNFGKAVDNGQTYDYTTFEQATELKNVSISLSASVTAQEHNSLLESYNNQRGNILNIINAYNTLCQIVTLEGNSDYFKITFNGDNVTIGDKKQFTMKKEWFELGGGMSYLINGTHVETGKLTEVLKNFYDEKYEEFVEEYKNLTIKRVSGASYSNVKFTKTTPQSLVTNAGTQFISIDYWTYMYYTLYNKITTLINDIKSGDNISPEDFYYKVKRKTDYENNMTNSFNGVTYEQASINKVSQAYDAYRNEWYEYFKVYDEFGEKYLSHPEDPVVNESSSSGSVNPDELTSTPIDPSSEYGAGEWWESAFDFLDSCGDCTNCKARVKAQVLRTYRISEDKITDGIQAEINNAIKTECEDQCSDCNANTVVLGGLDNLKDMVFYIGNIIFIVVTAFLGVKYIWGGADSKFSVKNSLVTLVVAAMVFYGWDAITNALNVKELLTGSTSATGYQNAVLTIYNTVMYIVNVLAIGGIIYLGIKYMMAGADGKAEMKIKFIPVVMGIIMVYGTLNLIKFILSITVGSL